MARNAAPSHTQEKARRWASVEEAAEYTGYGIRTIRRLIQNETIPAYRIPGMRLLRVDLNEIDAALQTATAA